MSNWREGGSGKDLGFRTPGIELRLAKNGIDGCVLKKINRKLI